MIQLLQPSDVPSAVWRQIYQLQATLPELASMHSSELHANLLDDVEDCEVYHCCYPSGEALIAISSPQQSSCIAGRGIHVVHNLAYGDGLVNQRLVRHVIKLARRFRLEWISLQHRTAPYTYVSKFIKLGAKYG